jgi:CubicO group peptidase (beta-lactamase class C family)
MPQKRCTAIVLTIAVGVTILVSVFACAQSTDRTQRVDAVFASLDKKGSPGCALAIIQDGKITYERGYGMANLDYDVPITPSSRFIIASTSKQFTAFSAALLEQQGKISLDDPITKYFPELPSAVYGPVTIRHLIHHTSGIRDFLSLINLAGRPVEDSFTHADFLDLLARQKALNFKPGDQYLYSNSGYLLLAILVKRASGKALPEFAAENIFKPLGMKDTFFRDDPTVIIKNRATGYSLVDGTYQFHAANFALAGSGGLVTTVDDLFLWDQNFYHNKLGNNTSDLIAEVQTPGKLNSGKLQDYAFGLMLENHKGLKMIGHAGNSFGYRADIIRFPDQKFSTICLCNSDSLQVSPSTFTRKVADIYLADYFRQDAMSAAKVKPVAESVSSIKLSDSELAGYAGVFQGAEEKTIWRLTPKGGKLVAELSTLQIPLSPVSQDHFRGALGAAQIDITFLPSATPRAIELEITAQAKSRLEAVETVSPTAAELARYAGEYNSEELDATYKLYMDGGTLFFKVRNERPTALAPLRHDEFYGGGVQLNFSRNAAGEFSQFSLDAGRVTGVRFVKKG